MFSLLTADTAVKRKTTCLWLLKCLNVYDFDSKNTVMIKEEIPFLTVTKKGSTNCAMVSMFPLIILGGSGCCALSMLPKSRLLISVSIYKYCDVFMMQYILNSHRSRNSMSGNFSMTTYLARHPSVHSNF
jgi:hypothetical protein